MAAINPAEDGRGHINVYSKGRTEVGRALSNFAFTPFVVPDHGTFASVEGYWYWLSTRNDRLRALHGFAAKQLGRELRGKDWVQDPEFRARITTALRAKVEQSPRIQTRLAESTLPFLHYYVFNGRVHDETQRCQWMLDVFDTLRSELRAARAESR